MVKNLPCNARDTGSIPGWGMKIPHSVEQLSPAATTTEPVVLQILSPHVLEPMRHNWRAHCATTTEHWAFCSPSSQLLSPHITEFLLCNKRSCTLQLRPDAAKYLNKSMFKMLMHSNILHADFLSLVFRDWAKTVPKLA